MARESRRFDRRRVARRGARRATGLPLDPFTGHELKFRHHRFGSLTIARRQAIAPRPPR
ncbi:hypothetical protein BGLA2_60116 [Burkholderia gladioli]|nr:hypothetical protein BGLA2_60116 [Burkholderia gladioli]